MAGTLRGRTVQGAMGAVGSRNANLGAPTATLVTTGNGSLVLGVGNDWGNATTRPPGTGQTVVHQYLALVGDTIVIRPGQQSCLQLVGRGDTRRRVPP